MSRHLLEALPEIADRIAASERLLLCLNFDGTLAPIVEQPADALLPPETRRLLRSLACNEHITVAIISGREKSDLLARVDVPGLIYAGNHGLEISGPGLSFIEPNACLFADAVKELAADLNTRLQGIPDVVVEDKGLTLSVHFRRVPADRWEEIRRITHGALANASHPFQLGEGNMVYEVRPRVYWHKGNTLAWLRTNLGRDDALMIYIGDDTSDEDAFAAVAQGVTVRVGNDARPKPETTAEYHVTGPAEVHDFLEHICEMFVPVKEA